MSKKTKQNFKIGSGYVDEIGELKTENMILKAEIQRLKKENETNARVNFELKRELTLVDNKEKKELLERIDFLECENEEMREKLKLIGDGADLLSICGLPMNLFNKVQDGLGIISCQEKINNRMHQTLKQIKTPIFIVEQEDK